MKYLEPHAMDLISALGGLPPRDPVVSSRRLKERLYEAEQRIQRRMNLTPSVFRMLVEYLKEPKRVIRDAGNQTFSHLGFTIPLTDEFLEVYYQEIGEVLPSQAYEWVVATMKNLRPEVGAHPYMHLDAEMKRVALSQVDFSDMDRRDGLKGLDQAEGLKLQGIVDELLLLPPSRMRHCFLEAAEEALLKLTPNAVAGGAAGLPGQENALGKVQESVSAVKTVPSTANLLNLTGKVVETISAVRDCAAKLVVEGDSELSPPLAHLSMIDHDGVEGHVPLLLAAPNPSELVMPVTETSSREKVPR